MTQTTLNSGKISDLDLKKAINKIKDKELSEVRESYVRIKISSRIKSFVDWDKEDITDDVHKEFHEKITEYIESLIVDNDEFDFDFLTYGWEDKPENVDEFSDLGQIGIQITREVK